MSQNEVATYFSSAKVSPPSLTENRLGMTPMEYRVSYINNLPVPVTIVWRSGLKFVLRPEPSMTNNKLLVRIHIVIGRAVKSDIERVLSEVTTKSSDELKAMREAFSLQIKESTYGGATVILDYPIGIDVLRNNGGSIYCHELDSVISLADINSVPYHPFSPEGRNQRIIEANTSVINQYDFNYSIEIVDNEGRYGERYLNISNKIYRVVPKMDPNRQNGVYVLSNSPVEGKLGISEVGVTYYTFDDAETELHLFRTREDAAELGDKQTARKRELAELDHEMALQRLELTRTKQLYEREVVERERETRRMEREREAHLSAMQDLREAAEHSMAFERQRIKDHYESLSFKRKDQSELVRWIPAIITGIGAILTVLSPLLVSAGKR
jgi:hypothetical protein